MSIFKSNSDVKNNNYVVQKFSELPKFSQLGVVATVRDTTGLIGARKHAGKYVFTQNGWKLLEKAK